MSQVSRVSQYVLVVAICALITLSSHAEACAICIPLPQKSGADYLLNAKTVVLARENPNKPFSYVAIEVLKGELDSPQIDLFLNSTFRRQLAFNPERSVVLALSGVQTKSSSSLWAQRVTEQNPQVNAWRSLGYASPRYEALVRDIILHHPTWLEKDGLRTRARYFMPLLADEEDSIRDLAYLEVGRMPYKTIKEADNYVASDQIGKFLAEPLYIEWHSLYILLLGINAQPSEKKTIREEMESRARFDQSLNLSAWATALVEFDGVSAIDWLENVYFNAPERETETVLEIVKALSVHGSLMHSDLRERIIESYGMLIKNHPLLVGWAARDLIAWNDWRFAKPLAQLRESGIVMDGPTALAVDYYIGLASTRVSQ